MFSIFVFLWDYLKNYQKELTQPKIEEIQANAVEDKIVAGKHSVRTSPIKIIVKSGQNLGSILKSYYASEKLIHKIDEAINKTMPKFVLKVDQELYISGTFSETDNSLDKLIIRLDSESEIILTVDENFDAKAELKKLKLIKYNQYISGSLDTNFYSALKERGVSPKIIKTAAVNLGYVINFQHEIKKGDKYQFLYEVYKDEQGNIIKYGNVLYMALEVNGKNERDFWFFKVIKKS